MDRRDNMSTYLKTGMEKVFVDNEKKLPYYLKMDKKNYTTTLLR
jgi:predicted TIM-barrel enzyme